MKNSKKSFAFSALDEVSKQHLLLAVDERVKRQKVSHQCENLKKESEPLFNVQFCDETSVPRETMNLIYLTTRQFNLLFNGPLKLLIEGPAGTGKTLIILLKILYLVRSETPFNILLIAPFPHSVRCKRFLEDNNVDARLEDSFPIKLLDNCDRKQASQPIVRVVDLTKLSDWCDTHIKLIGPVDIHGHVFVDDFQSIKGSEVFLNSFKQTHADTYMWLAFDPIQYSYYSLVDQTGMKNFKMAMQKQYKKVKDCEVLLVRPRKVF